MNNELLTERQRVIVEALGRQWLEGHRDGFNQAAVILTDLITELRSGALICQTAAGDVMWPDEVAYQLDRAEARLRKVTGDE